MHTNLKTAQFVLIGLFSCSVLFGQETALQELPGAYRNAAVGDALKTAPELNRLSGQDRITVTHDLTVQHEVLMQTPSLRSFKGMEARLYGYMHPASGFLQRTTGEMRVMFYPFTRAFKTGKIVPVDEAPASLSVFTNDLDKVLFNADGWRDLASRVGFPQFFEKFPISDSTPDYMEIRANGRIFRILQLNDKPVFIPLTRKEFMQFLLLSEEKQSRDARKIVSDNQEYAKRSREKKDGYLGIYEENISVWQKNLSKSEAKLSLYRNEIAQMTTAQASSGAYINHNKAGGYYEQLSLTGRRDGTALYKVNPDYFDKNKSRSAAQLLVVSYWYHSQFTANWLRSYVKKLFEEIDYSRLKKEMK